MTTGRTILFGDVHGCIDELDRLLDRLALRAGDRLCFLGDLVDRGPDSVGVIRRVRILLARFPGSACIAGNHEEKALRFRDRGGSRAPWAEDASDEDWAFLESLPLVWRLPEHGAVIVHGGFFPRFFEHHGAIGEVSPGWRRARDKRSERLRRFLRVRGVDARGEMVALGSEDAGTTHWSARYDGREGFCFFGHDPQLEPVAPLVREHAIGLDTGCCFGGALTAAILEPGEPARAAQFVSVPGKRYAEPRARFSE